MVDLGPIYGHIRTIYGKRRSSSFVFGYTRILKVISVEVMASDISVKNPKKCSRTGFLKKLRSYTESIWTAQTRLEIQKERVKKVIHRELGVLPNGSFDDQVRVVSVNVPQEG